MKTTEEELSLFRVGLVSCWWTVAKINTVGVFQIASFCTEYLIFSVHMKKVHVCTENIVFTVCL